MGGKMKVLFVLFATLSLALAQVSRREIGVALIQKNQDGCLTCVDDIMKAVADCSAQDVDLLTCITEAIGRPAIVSTAFAKFWKLLADLTTSAPRGFFPKGLDAISS